MGMVIQMLPSAGAAALVAAAILASARSWNNAGDGAALALGLGLGYTAGHVVAAGLPALPPANTTQWLFVFGIAAALIAVIVELVRPSRVVQFVIWTAAFAVAARRLLEPRFQYAWHGWQAWLAFAVILSVALLFAWCVGPARELQLELPLAGAILSAATSAALMLSGSLLLGQLAFALAAATATSFLFGFRGLSFRQGFAPVFFLLLASLWLSGYFYAELPALSVVFFVVAMLVMFVWPRPVAPQEWKALTFRAALLAVPAAIAVVVAFRASPSLDY